MKLSKSHRKGNLRIAEAEINTKQRSAGEAFGTTVATMLDA